MYIADSDGYLSLLGYSSINNLCKEICSQSKDSLPYGDIQKYVEMHKKQIDKICGDTIKSSSQFSNENYITLDGVPDTKPIGIISSSSEDLGLQKPITSGYITIDNHMPTTYTYNGDPNHTMTYDKSGVSLVEIYFL